MDIKELKLELRIELKEKIHFQLQARGNERNQILAPVPAIKLPEIYIIKYWKVIISCF
jgi:hypothetical protein